MRIERSVGCAPRSSPTIKSAVTGSSDRVRQRSIGHFCRRDVTAPWRGRRPPLPGFQASPGPPHQARDASTSGVSPRGQGRALGCDRRAVGAAVGQRHVTFSLVSAWLVPSAATVVATNMATVTNSPARRVSARPFAVPPPAAPRPGLSRAPSRSRHAVARGCRPGQRRPSPRSPVVASDVAPRDGCGSAPTQPPRFSGAKHLDGRRARHPSR
jgi:hypothetical protein